MPTVHDVAAYILRKLGPMSAMKLQKLTYYSQAWHLVWEDKPLYRARIEAWALGPVVPELYRHHAQTFHISTWPKGDPDQLDKAERGTVNAVLDFYGDKTAQWLSDLSHKEDPWLKARRGVPEGARSENEVSHAAMQAYYGGLSLRRKSKP